MKEGWTYKKLGEVCNLIGGGTPSKKNASYYNGSILWATVRDMNCDVLTSTEYSITEEGLNDSASHIVDKGEIIIATRVGLGKVCKLAQPTAINQDLKGVVPKKENINRDFLFYYFKTIAKYIESNGVGATVKGVKMKFIEELDFPIPPLSEQQRIVSRLDSAFAHIDELKANAEKQLCEARLLFQKALAKAMEPKEGWLKDTLIEIFNFIDYRGATPTKLEKGIPLVTAKNVKFGYLDYSIKDYISKEEYESRKGRGISHKGDILFTTEAPLGNVAIADLEEFSAGQRLITLQQYNNSKYNIVNEFYYYYMLGPVFQNRINELATGATAQGIKAKLLKTVIAPIPPLSEQQRIVSRLDSLAENVRKLEEVLQKTITECDALKQALLRKVFE